MGETVRPFCPEGIVFLDRQPLDDNAPGSGQRQHAVSLPRRIPSVQKGPPSVVRLSGIGQVEPFTNQSWPHDSRRMNRHTPRGSPRTT